LYAGLSITGAVGSVYTIQYTTNLAQTNAWLTLTNLALATTPFMFIDETTAATGRRFYRAILADQGPPEMVWVAPGTFDMGSSSNAQDALPQEGPQTTVTLTKGFYMGKYLVTQGEYVSLLSNSPSIFSPTNGYNDWLNRPVETVSWSDATNFCAKLTQRERAAGRLATNWTYRLPTEAEWEYACRAGTTTMFSYGDDPLYTNLVYFAWYGLNSGSQTHPVGRKAPNPWGLFDMAGNVSQMCQDWYGPYLGGSVIDPQGPPTGSAVVIRNCGWACNDPRTLRSASRNNWNIPSVGLDWIGFRVVKAQSP
jgi:formylglycine-generating enzyme required for sulfatase activity